MLKEKLQKVFKLNLSNGNAELYTGTIMKVFANGVTLDKEGIKPIIQKSVFKSNAEFKRFNDFFGTSFISIAHNTRLASEEEALDHTNRIVKSRELLIQDILNSNPEKREAFFKQLAQDSSCIYLDEKTITKRKEK